MPGGDKTGPTGAGPMTGRGAGYCSGAGAPGYSNPGFGGGFGRMRGGGFGVGRGMGGGRGHRHWYWATGLPGWARGGRGWAYGSANQRAVAPDAVGQDNELAFLREQADYLEASLKEVNQRIKELQQTKGD